MAKVETDTVPGDGFVEGCTGRLSYELHPIFVGRYSSIDLQGNFIE